MSTNHSGSCSLCSHWGPLTAEQRAAAGHVSSRSKPRKGVAWPWEIMRGEGIIGWSSSHETAKHDAARLELGKLELQPFASCLGHSALAQLEHTLKGTCINVS